MENMERMLEQNSDVEASSGKSGGHARQQYGKYGKEYGTIWFWGRNGPNSPFFPDEMEKKSVMTNQIIDLEKSWKMLEKTKNLHIFQLMDVAVKLARARVSLLTRPARAERFWIEAPTIEASPISPTKQKHVIDLLISMILAKISKRKDGNERLHETAEAKEEKV